MEEKTKNNDVHFKAIAGNTLKEDIDRREGKSKGIREAFGLIAIAVLVGNDMAKLLLRRNFSISIVGYISSFIAFLVILCSGLFFLAQYASFSINPGNDLIDELLSVPFYSLTEWVGFHLLPTLSYSFRFSFLLTGIVFVFIAIRLLKKAIELRKRTVENDPLLSFEGESDMLAFLTEYGWSETKIRFVGEPLYLIILAILSVFANLIGGLPLFLAAISIWLFGLLEIILELFFGSETSKDGAQPPEQFHKVGNN